MISRFLVFFLVISSLQGCNTNKQGIGTITGAAVGGLLGSRFGKGGGAVLATAGGAMLGAFLGGSIGKQLDDQDKKIMQLTSQRALESAPSGNSIEWSNPDSGHYGTVTPTNTFQDDDSRYCREYTQTVMIGGEQQKAYGTACRMPDGSWQVQN